MKVFIVEDAPQTRQELAEYQKAFGDATELPLTLRPLESWQPAHRHQALENPFCALLAQANRTCAACLEVQHRAVESAKEGPATVTCFAGLCDTAVPIHLGERTIGFLVTGQVALDAPSELQFDRITRQIIAWGSQVDLKRLKEAYFHSKVLAPGQYAGVIRLLEIFGKHLSLAANQIALREAQAEPPLVRRAKALLLNPHLHVSEIADAVGFQSLTHFNRVFRELTGESPTGFRENRAGETNGASKTPGAGSPRRHPARPERISSHEQ
jgi:hypothetical protein